jgi:hypothetical protein
MASAISIWDLPAVPAVFGLYGGDRRRLVFLGVADLLLERVLEQLVVPRLGYGPAGNALFMQPGYIGEVRWWEHGEFAESDATRAAEFVASDLLEPLLSSRRPSSAAARDLYDDPGFRERMRELFAGEPSGVATIPTLDDVMARLSALEARLGDGGGPRTTP